MYTFRKIKLSGWSKPHWYLQANSVADVLDHFNTICRREIAAGCKEYVEDAVVCPDGSLWHPHPDTPFGVSTNVLENTMGIPWLTAALILENQTLQDRIRAFRDERCINLYLADNLTWFSEYEDMDVEMVEERMSDELIYPIEEIFTYSDIRTMKWNIPGMSIRGTHYYAKVDKFDVIGPDGSMKWNTESEALRAGRWWVDEYNRKASEGAEYMYGRKYINGKLLDEAE